eukprot:3201547-Rhodomonas_salina.1
MPSVAPLWRVEMVVLYCDGAPVLAVLVVLLNVSDLAFLDHELVERFQLDAQGNLSVPNCWVENTVENMPVCNLDCFLQFLHDILPDESARKGVRERAHDAAAIASAQKMLKRGHVNPQEDRVHLLSCVRCLVFCMRVTSSRLDGREVEAAEGLSLSRRLLPLPLRHSDCTRLFEPFALDPQHVLQVFAMRVPLRELERRWEALPTHHLRRPDPGFAYDAELDLCERLEVAE